MKSSPTAANQPHAYREEYTFIQSEEIDNKSQEDKNVLNSFDHQARLPR
jgi:hypothetical protein